MNDLGDFTGLFACGERIYEVQTQIDLIWIDSVAREVHLFNSVTAHQVGEYTADILVYLEEYPSVTTQFQLLFNIQQEPSPDEEPKDEEQVDPEEDFSPMPNPDCEIEALVNY